MPFGLYGQNNTLAVSLFGLPDFPERKSTIIKKLPKTISSSFLIANAVCLSDI